MNHTHFEIHTRYRKTVAAHVYILHKHTTNKSSIPYVVNMLNNFLTLPRGESKISDPKNHLLKFGNATGNLLLNISCLKCFDIALSHVWHEL